MGLLRPKRRLRWLKVHRWLGLVLGPVFLLLGLSGSVLVYYNELDRRLEPALAAVADAPVHSWQGVLQALEHAHPQRDQGWRIELRPERRGVVTARYLKPAESREAFFAPLLVSVDPASGQVVANRVWGRFAATWLFDLHYTLLGGERGRAVVGLVGVLLSAVLVGGLVLWWPSRGQWRAALRLRLGGSPQRRHYDQHKLCGLAGGAVLLVLTLTGTALALPSVVEPAVQGLSAPAPWPRAQAPRQPQRPLLPLDALLQAAERRYPHSQARWVDTPAHDSALVRVRLWQPGDPARRFPHTYVWLHAQTGEVLAVRDLHARSKGEAAMAWLRPLHNGEALGTPGRLLAVAAGAVQLLLGISGWQRWRDRRSAAQGRRAAGAPARLAEG